MKRIMLFSMFCGSLLASYAMAAELYVDQNNPAAADKNPGTEAKPFRTIQAGVDTAKPGDTIWVKAGLYQDPVHIKKSGRPGEPITLSRVERRPGADWIPARASSRAGHVAGDPRKQKFPD